MKYQTAFINAFAEGLSDGNTAAVVLVDSYPPDSEMLSIAKQFGFSETAFILPQLQGKYQIRWFTPELEVSLCGHATLASAHFLFSTIESATESLIFSSLSGELLAIRTTDAIELNFPLDTPLPYPAEATVLQALPKVHPIETLFAPLTRNLVVVVATSQAVTELAPDFSKLADLKDLPYYGIAVTAATPEGYICRYFAPWEGINEDPVTGSAQTFLAPYWVQKTGKTDLAGYQASARGGHLTISIKDERLLLRGKAVTYLQGSLILP